MEHDYKYVKVVETQQVTADSLERIINENVAEGWVFDTIHFATRESSKRPAMAFVMFFSPKYAAKAALPANPKKACE